MTAKQKAFVAAYLVCRNATKAAIEAGYSKKTAYEIGANNLKKATIKRAIDEAEAKALSEAVASRTEILEFLTATMRDVEKTQKDRLNAAKMLGDYYSLYKNEANVDGEEIPKIEVRFIDCSDDVAATADETNVTAGEKDD